MNENPQEELERLHDQAQEREEAVKLRVRSLNERFRELGDRSRQEFERLRETHDELSYLRIGNAMAEIFDTFVNDLRAEFQAYSLSMNRFLDTFSQVMSLLAQNPAGRGSAPEISIQRVKGMRRSLEKASDDFRQFKTIILSMHSMNERFGIEQLRVAQELEMFIKEFDNGVRMMIDTQVELMKL